MPVPSGDYDEKALPLHAAIAASQHDTTEEEGKENVKTLLQNGAPWNQLDENLETPGCVARRLGLTELYELMVDAGVRAELLLNRLDGYQALPDGNSEDDEDEDVDWVGNGEGDGETKTESQDCDTNTTEPDVSSSRYLQSSLSFQDDRVLDGDQNGVMMAWESDIMSRTAKALLPARELRVLNVGHGMGIIDNFFQTQSPSAHHIIEAHPTVLADMRTKGWYEKPGVTIHEGKWQDVLPNLVEGGVTFDAIYYDTFAESYMQFRDFLSEHVIGLLDPGGKWSFFNGMGADRQISYDVYQKVVEMDLLEAGFDVEWEEIDVPDLGGEWKGVRRKYWAVDRYRLPMCEFLE